MTRTKLRWAAALCVAATLPAAAVRGEDPWWVTKPRPTAAVSAAAAPAAVLGRPAPTASLGRPIPVPETGWNTQAPADAGWNVPTALPASYDQPTAAMPAGYDATPGALLAPRVARGQPADPAPPGALVGPPPAPVAGDGGYNTGAAVDQPLRRPFFEGCGDWFNFGTRPSAAGGEWFKSDCLCDNSLISPVTNPFYFEDPRALTEIRPLLIVQKVPGANGGGSAEFFGLQGRLALSERWSIVVNKLGFVSLNPNRPIAGTRKDTGFAEINLGPKFTFWRDENLRNAAAVGLTLQLPIGSKSVFQDTGTLGLVPYVSYGQTFGRSSFGSFDFMGELGYSASVDNKRSEFVQSSLHLDYDVANWHRIYPLVEMNYFYYTKHGTNTDLGFEGADLVNFGSRTNKQRDLLTIAPGFRYKFTEWAQTGFAVEFPLTGQKGFEQYRFTWDLIFRY